MDNLSSLAALNIHQWMIPAWAEFFYEYDAINDEFSTFDYDGGSNGIVSISGDLGMSVNSDRHKGILDK